MENDSRSDVTIVPVKNDGDLAQALAIREIVFIEEQHVPEGIERDADDSSAYHLLALRGGHAIGTGRLVMLQSPPDGEQGAWGKVGRMAVLLNSRKGGVGSRLLTALEEEARRRSLNGILLNAQLSALDFYKKHGYVPMGAVFEEAGMPHLQMKKRL